MTQSWPDQESLALEMSGFFARAIDAAGIQDNTIVVWTSDNGPETLIGNNMPYGGMSDTGPFRGEFPSGWEANYPWMFDIEDDPKELSNISSANNWAGVAVAKYVGAPRLASLKDHPNLKPGAEGPEEHDPTPTEIMPPMDGKD
jgi:hypothetical protein